MTSNWLLSRVVELAGTYLLQSTAFLATAWCLLSVLALFSRRTAGRSDARLSTSFGLDPLLVERTWKLAAVLGLLTAPMSVFAGWSQPAWKWSISEYSSSARTIHTRNSDVDRGDPITNPDSQMGHAYEFEGDEPGGAADESSTAVSQNTHRSSIHTSFGFVVQTNSTDTVVDPERPAGGGSKAIPFASTNAQLSSQHPKRTSSRSITSASGTSPSPWIHRIGIACFIWLAWTLFRLVMRALSLRRLLTQCEPVNGELQNQLNRLTPNGCRIRLLRSRPLTPKQIGMKSNRSMSEPFACGLFRWTIVFPEWVERDLSAAERKALLAHEVAHLIRRDPWWLLIGEFLCTCLALQPLNFLARSRWQRATELLCDDWAVERHVSATSLATCLTCIAESRFPASAAVPGLAAMGRSGSLTERIQWLLRSERSPKAHHHRGRIVASLVTLAAGLLVSLYSPHVAIVQSAEASDNAQEVATWDNIESDLIETVNSLASLESELLEEDDAARLVSSLLARTAALKLRLDRSPPALTSP